MSDFQRILQDVFGEQRVLRAVLSKKRQPDLAERVTVRPITLRGARLYQFACRQNSGETHENLKPADAAERVCSLLGSKYEHCHLYTTEADYSARIKPDGRIRYRRLPPSKEPQSTEHDRPKRHLIPEGAACPFLTEIGVMTASGKVRRAKYNKFRQVNRFLELVDDVTGDLPDDDPLQVVDFGCGKSYLTFALHHLLTTVHKRGVEITGLDRDAQVVRDCRQIAARLGLQGLEFRVGDIASHERRSPVNLAVSLHACDTATDDALAKAVGWKADVILAVPCCQHELAAKIGGDRLDALLQHGILRERLAALATDALRARALEICGYRVQVVEFVEMEHTAKNVLIRAVRATTGRSQFNAEIDSYRKLKETLGLGRIYLEEALGERFARLVS